jgi:hypothetical protein
LHTLGFEVLTAVTKKLFSGKEKTPWSTMRAIIYFGGKLLPFLGSKNEPSKKAA